MNLMRTLPLVVAFQWGPSPQCRTRKNSQTSPTRDVDISYQITRLGQPVIVERRRWLASQHLRRVDGSDNSATIFDQNREELTLLNAANHTYRTVEWPVAKRMSPQKGTTLKRGGEYKIAGQNCIDWSWMDGTEMHTAIDVATLSSASSAVSRTGDALQQDTTASPETISPHSLSLPPSPSGSE
jgi:hypothetical protein